MLQKLDNPGLRALKKLLSVVCGCREIQHRIIAAGENVQLFSRLVKKHRKEFTDAEKRELATSLVKSLRKACPPSRCNNSLPMPNACVYYTFGGIGNAASTIPAASDDIPAASLCVMRSCRICKAFFRSAL